MSASANRPGEAEAVACSHSRSEEFQQMADARVFRVCLQCGKEWDTGVLRLNLEDGGVREISGGEGPGNAEEAGEKLTAPVLKLLEKVFAAEISGALPYQCRPSKTVQRALEEGLISPLTTRMGAVTVTGYELSHRGRILYCESCAGAEDEETAGVE